MSLYEDGGFTLNLNLLHVQPRNRAVYNHYPSSIQPLSYSIQPLSYMLWPPTEVGLPSSSVTLHPCPSYLSSVSLLIASLSNDVETWDVHQGRPQDNKRPVPGKGGGGGMAQLTCPVNTMCLWPGRTVKLSVEAYTGVPRVIDCHTILTSWIYGSGHAQRDAVTPYHVSNFAIRGSRVHLDFRVPCHHVGGGGACTTDRRGQLVWSDVICTLYSHGKAT